MKEDEQLARALQESLTYESPPQIENRVGNGNGSGSGNYYQPVPFSYSVGFRYNYDFTFVAASYSKLINVDI